MASEDTSHGEILSRSVFLALFIRFWLLTELFWPFTEVGMGNFDLLLLVTDDKDLVTGWFEAKDVSWNWLEKFFIFILKADLHIFNDATVVHFA